MKASVRKVGSGNEVEPANLEEKGRKTPSQEVTALPRTGRSTQICHESFAFRNLLIAATLPLLHYSTRMLATVITIIR